MIECFTSVNKGIHYPFIVDSKCFSDDADQFLKDSPDSVGDRELDYSIRSLMEQSSNSFIGCEAFDRSKYVVLEYCNRYSSNLGSKAPGLGFTHTEQVFCFFEKDFN